MLRLSKLTDYGVVVLAALDDSPVDAVRNAAGLAAATGLAEPTVAKVLKTLTGAGLVDSQRGARGGYRLARPLADIALPEVILAFDGPIALTACVDGGDGLCGTAAICPVKGRWDRVNDAIRSALSDITVADLAAPRFAPVAASAGS